MALRTFLANNKFQHRVEASEAQNADRPFGCHLCGVELSRVSAHVIRGEDEHLRRDVPAFFRLKSGLKHAGKCPCTVEGALDLLLRGSRAVEDGLPAEFEQVLGTLQFRLNIPMVMTKKRQEAYPTEAFGERVGVIWKEGSLDSYCRSAVGLAIIWNSVDEARDRRELSERVVIADRGKTLPWNQFFFPHSRYESLAKQLSKKKKQPRAVALTVKNVRHRENQYSVVQCAAVRTSERNGYLRVGPVILAPSTIAKKFRIGSQYIAFGDWFLGDENEYQIPETTHKIKFQNVMVTVHRAAQLARFDVAGEGDDVPNP